MAALLFILQTFLQIWSLKLIYGTMYTYDIETLNEKIFTPCEEYPNNFIDKWVDISKINFTFQPNGDLRISGPIIILQDFSDKKLIKLNSNVYKKNRGTWMNTIYNVRRNDFCASAFNPIELWHQYTKHIATDKRICPPNAGLYQEIDLIATGSVDLPDRKAEGHYKIRAKMEYGEEKQNFICFELPFIGHKI